jgi:ubiquinone/menaquinone biosynthesis C-methylase UbiE
MNAEVAGIRIPDRLTWAVQRLASRPDDEVLEVGCGTGVAASLLCEQLTEGQLTAIDRSAAMVAAAQRRNRAHIATGRAIIRRMALADADFDGDSFDRALAVHVNAFWLDPTSELDVLKRLLRPRGVLCLVYQPPAVSQISWIADACSGFLRRHGFVGLRVDVKELLPTPGVCITARVSAASPRLRSSDQLSVRG